MTPGEIGLLVFVLVFLISAFIVIYLVITGVALGSSPFPPPPPVPTGGPNTGNPPSSCNQGMLNDDNNCCVTGIVCNTTVLQYCTNGSCQCVTGSILCPMAGFGGTPACVFTVSNVNNCGGCGVVCTGGATCCDGVCVDVLSPSQTGSCGSCSTVCTGPGSTCCNGFCRSLQTDPLNCTACLNACGQGQLCCGGCTGPDDPNNCGGCGIQCTGATVCQANVCVPGCPTGFTQCGSPPVCLDTLSNNFNCGSCSNPCPNGSFCEMGTCSPNVCVNAGEIFCPEAGGCINVQANRDLCGDCATRCVNGACINGQCQCLTNFDCAGGYTCQPSTVETQTLVPSGAPANIMTGPGPGFCAPPPCFVAGQVYCASTENCTSVDMDPLNCGDCNTICRSGTCNGSGLCTCDTADDCPLGSDCIVGTCRLH